MDQSLQKKEDRALARKGLIYSELSVSEIPMWQLPGKGKVTPDSLSKIVFRMTEMNGQVVKVPIRCRLVRSGDIPRYGISNIFERSSAH
jgi:hypothetical protein